jgi:hypothetical protein
VKDINDRIRIAALGFAMDFVRPFFMKVRSEDVSIRKRDIDVSSLTQLAALP